MMIDRTIVRQFANDQLVLETKCVLYSLFSSTYLVVCSMPFGFCALADEVQRLHDQGSATQKRFLDHKNCCENIYLVL